MGNIPKWKAVLYDWRQRRIMDAAGSRLDKLSLTRDTDARPEQMARLAEVSLSAVEEFDGMLARVGLDSDAAPLKAAARLELYLNCIDCSRRQSCRQWLAADREDGGYKDFCPNAEMFDRLLEIERCQSCEADLA